MVGILMTNALPIGGSWGLMESGSQKWPRMGELRLIKGDGTDITIHRDDSVTMVQHKRRMEQCDGCEKYALESEGTAYRDEKLEIILWFCHKCVLMNNP